MLALARVLNLLLLLAAVPLTLLGGAYAAASYAEATDPAGNPWAGLGVALGLLAALPGLWWLVCCSIAAAGWRRRPATALMVAAVAPGVPGLLLLAAGLGGGVGWMPLPVALALLLLAGVHVAAYGVVVAGPGRPQRA